MPHITADRVKETTTTIGTAALVLAGAPTGFRAFSAVMAANDTCYYCVVGGAEWEVGLGTFSTTLTRTTVFASSNAGAAVVFSAGTKDVFITLPAQRVVDPYWLMQTTNYTMGNVATQQKLFNQTANGTLALTAGIYEFECQLFMSGMSATSGNMGFNPIGAGTAVADRFGYDARGVDGSNVSVATVSGSGAITAASQPSVVTPGVALTFRGRFSGIFRISTAGTITPSGTLVTASPAVVEAGSWFAIKKIGESTQTTFGPWS